MINKKWIIGLSLIFALGIVSCNNKKEIKEEICISNCEDKKAEDTKCKCVEADCVSKCKEIKEEKN